jgi:hypothetical protein
VIFGRLTDISQTATMPGVETAFGSMYEMVSNQLTARALALNPDRAIEDSVFGLTDAENSVVVRASAILSLLVLLVVRIIIGGLVAVGGFARS